MKPFHGVIVPSKRFSDIALMVFYACQEEPVVGSSPVVERHRSLQGKVGGREVASAVMSDAKRVPVSSLLGLPVDGLPRQSDGQPGITRRRARVANHLPCEAVEQSGELDAIAVLTSLLIVD